MLMIDIEGILFSMQEARGAVMQRIPAMAQSEGLRDLGMSSDSEISVQQT